MDRKLINPAIVQDIADAIREKGGQTEPIVVNALGDAIRALPQGMGDNTTEVVEAISGEQPEGDIAIANAIAKGATDAAREHVWQGERTTDNGREVKDGVAFVDAVKGQSVKVVQIVIDSFVDTKNGVTFSHVNGVVTMKGTATSDIGALMFVPVCSENRINGHTYLYFIVNTKGEGIGLRLNNGNWYTYSTSRINKADTSVRAYIHTANVVEIMQGETVDYSAKIGLFDLTAMGMEDVVDADDFAHRLGYADAASLPYIPYGEQIVNSKPTEVVSRGARLPSEYQEVEYLECNERSIVNTNLPLNGCDVYVKLSAEPKSATQLSLGYGEQVGCWFGYSATLGWTIGGGIAIKKNEGVFHVQWSDNVQTLYDGDVVVGSRENPSISSEERILSFGMIDSRYLSYAKLYDMIVYREGIEYHFIPCYRKIDNLGGLYDVLNNRFYGRISSIPFIVGNDLYPKLSTLPLPLSSIMHEGQPLFPNGLCGIGDVKDEVDWAKGKAVKRIGVVDMGTLLWYYESQSIRFTAVIPDATTEVRNINLLNGIHTPNISPTSNTHVDMTMDLYGGRIYLNDFRYTTAISFKAAMQGVLLYYELADPIEVTFDPAKAFYRVQNGGTEEAVMDGVSAPLVADIAYRDNMAYSEEAALLAFANERSGQNDADLGDAIRTLSE